jgi:flagellar hook-associated protein 1
VPNFAALSTAYSALTAHRARTDLIAQNLANVDTPGYSRLRGDLTTTATSGGVGIYSGSRPLAGVQLSTVTRMKDLVLEQQARDASTRSSSLAEQARALSQIEQRVDGLNDDSLSGQLNALWNSFADLADDPAAMAPRQSVLLDAERVASSLNQLAEATRTQRQGEIFTINIRVAEVNDLAASIASLRQGITVAHLTGSPANDLLDKQDRLVDQLSELVDVRVTRRTDGTVDLHLDGHDLVSEGRANPIGVATGDDLGHGMSRVDLVAVGRARPLTIGGGALGGLQTVVNQTLPAHLDDLDVVAGAIVSTVNPIHASGRDLDGNPGTALFTGTTASTIALNPALANQPRRVVAAGATDGPLGNTVALSLGGLADGTDDPALVFEQLVSRLGADVASLGTHAAAAQSATVRAQAAATAVSGVSMDEELASLIETQRSYEAAARLMTTIDQMLDTLINRTGLVGR